MFKARKGKGTRAAETDLSWSQKVARLKLRLGDKEWRRYGGLLILGKLMGLAALATLLVGI